MKLKQINLNYQAGQDRILLRVSTHSGLEYQAWLTRRIVQRLVPALDQNLPALGFFRMFLLIRYL